MGPGTEPSGSWFKLGFPSGYVADFLQALEALCEAGMAAEPRSIAPSTGCRRAGCPGSLAEPLPLLGQDGDRHRPARPAEQMGDAPSLPGPQGGRRVLKAAAG